MVQVQRIRHFATMILGKRLTPLEMSTLQLRLSSHEMRAVNLLRQGMNVRVSDDNDSQRCMARLSVELYALAWTSDPPGLVGLDQIIDIGVMSSTGEFRSWSSVQPHLPAEGIAALRKLVEAKSAKDASRGPLNHGMAKNLRISYKIRPTNNSVVRTSSRASSSSGQHSSRYNSRTMSTVSGRAFILERYLHGDKDGRKSRAEKLSGTTPEGSPEGQRALKSGSPKPGMLKRGMTAGNLLRRPDLNSFLSDSSKAGAARSRGAAGGSSGPDDDGNAAKRCSSDSSIDAEVDASVTSLSSSISTSSADASVVTHDRSVTAPRCRTDMFMSDVDSAPSRCMQMLSALLTHTLLTPPLNLSLPDDSSSTLTTRPSPLAPASAAPNKTERRPTRTTSHWRPRPRQQRA